MWILIKYKYSSTGCMELVLQQVFISVPIANRYDSTYKDAS